MICGGLYHWACDLYDLDSEVSDGDCDILILMETSLEKLCLL